jgi:hypothetical protein
MVPASQRLARLRGINCRRTRSRVAAASLGRLPVRNGRSEGGGHIISAAELARKLERSSHQISRRPEGRVLPIKGAYAQRLTGGRRLGRAVRSWAAEDRAVAVVVAADAGVVGEYFVPLAEGSIGGDDGARVLVTARDELEEQVGRCGGWSRTKGRQFQIPTCAIPSGAEGRLLEHSGWLSSPLANA